jgi:hypothetical protein
MSVQTAVFVPMNTTPYLVRVKHDEGYLNIRIHATGEEAAKKMVMEIEGCPIGAITKVVNLQLYLENGKDFTAYAFSCGYEQRIETNDDESYAMMYFNLPIYTVIHVIDGERTEFTFHSNELTKARKFFKSFKK